MRVVEVTEFGGPEVLVVGVAADPAPAAGEVVVDVAFAEILFLDAQLRRGWGREYFPLDPPFVPGVGVSGTVGALGEGVDPSWRGHRVISGTSGPGGYAGGGYAERTIVRADQLVEVPDGLGLDVALAARSDGFMGLTRIEAAHLGADDTVLITAAAGSIGVWLVPLARAAGARVIGAARGSEKVQLVSGWGAEAVVDYGRDDYPTQMAAATDGRPLSLVFDGVGGEVGTAAYRMLARGGHFFGYGSASGSFVETTDAEQRGITVTGLDEEVTSSMRREYAARALVELAAGRVVPVLGQVLPLEQAAEAHRAMDERRVAGKSLLRI